MSSRLARACGRVVEIQTRKVVWRHSTGNFECQSEEFICDIIGKQEGIKGSPPPHRPIWEFCNCNLCLRKNYFGCDVKDGSE